jgi:hypothetical protein
MKKQTIIKALLIAIPLMALAYWYWSKKAKEDEPTNENAQIPIEPVDNVPTLETRFLITGQSLQQSSSFQGLKKR